MSRMTPERARLAEIVAQHVAERAADKAAIDADDSFYVRAAAAEEAVATSEEWLKAAKAAATKAVVTGEIDASMPTVAAARAALEAARDDLDAVNAARDVVRAKAREARDSLDSRPFGMDEAIAAVVKAEGAVAIAKLVDDVEALQRELFVKLSALDFLHANKAVSTAHVSDGTAYGTREPKAAIVLGRVYQPPMQWQGLPGDGAAVWRDAFKALRTDANAAVPK